MEARTRAPPPTRCMKNLICYRPGSPSAQSASSLSSLYLYTTNPFTTTTSSHHYHITFILNMVNDYMLGNHSQQQKLSEHSLPTFLVSIINDICLVEFQTQLQPSQLQILQMSQNYYDLLGVPKSASKDQIKKAYKKLALKHHPDKNINDVQGAKKKFTKLAEAYAVLSDDKKRADYDNPPPPPPPQQNSFRASQNNYQWKNPEFDPNFNHFQQPPRFSQQAPNQRFDIPMFKGFQNYNTFKPFSNFSFQFGAFTFEMAEQIFNNVFTEDSNLFKQLKNDVPTNNLQLNRIQSMPQPRDPYQPKNSTLLSQKTVQRNGKLILVRKFSVNENGRVNKYTHESVIR